LLDLICDTSFTPKAAAQEFEGKQLRYADIKKYNIRVLRESFIARTSSGKFIAMLVKEVIPEDLLKKTSPVLNGVKGIPSNRPEIFGKGAQLRRIKKDGSLSARMGVPQDLLDANPRARADIVGPYRYKNKAPGVPDCDYTNWTKREPRVYEASYELAHKVSELYAMFLPDFHAQQMEYVNWVQEDWKLNGTAYTTTYVIKDKPTAVHRDDFDIPTATGAMTSHGDFKGAELCIPECRIAIDYQPGDVLFADVHQWLTKSCALWLTLKI
jgi:hypothetical protein